MALLDGPGTHPGLFRFAILLTEFAMKPCASMLALALATTACATTNDSAPPTAQLPPDAMMAPSPDEIMAMAMEAGTPGEIHEALAAMAGSWNVQYEYWMEPGGEATAATGTSTYRSIMGGRFMIEEFHSEFAGQPFEGMLLMGYDNVREQIQTLWLDSFSTGFQLQWGDMDDVGNKHLQGMIYDPMTPEGRPMRSELHGVGSNDFHMEMYDSLPDGGEWMTMRFHYTRTGG